jgi:phage terminase large subunit-like protein
LAKLTRGNRNIRWIEKYCRIPEGRDVGKPVRLRPWQKKDIRRIYDNPHGTRLAILSFGKKNAKTTLCAFLLLLHLCGPEAQKNSQLPSTAKSKEQAGALYKLTAKIVRMSSALSDVLICRDTIKEIYCAELGTLYKALSAEASTAHGQSPIFAIHDELGQVRGPISELYNAIENAMGAHENPLSIIISTQAPKDSDLLSILIDDAKNGYDPTVVLSVYSADENIDPFSVKAIKQANPAYGDFLSKKELIRQAKTAKRLPSEEALYRNYVLNQRVEASNPFITRTVWQACGNRVVANFDDRPVYGGLDLSEVRDLTALVLMADVDGIWQVEPTFWLPEQGLVERSRQDRVLYNVWHNQGYLRTIPGKTVDYDYVAAHIFGLFEKYNIAKIAFDRWNWRHFKPCLARAGFDEYQLEGDDAVFEQFGQGFQSMSPAMRDLEGALLNEKISHGNHPVLTMCAANAVVQSDPAGNRKLVKSKSTGRIDGMVSLTMAMGVAGSYIDESAGPSVYEERGIMMV